MKKLVQPIIGILLLGLTAFPVKAAFSSLYVFGDALSATADNPAPGPAQYFYQKHDSNGRVWIEVLAQRQGLTFDNTKNDSYYDHNSATLVTEINNFKAPSDVKNDLFIVWVCNADTFDAAQNHDTSLQWTLATTASQSNHLLIITSLYAKGVRTLIMPNAVDISEIPAYNRATSAKTMQAGCIAYNAALANTINTARLLCPGLTIYTPDYYTLLNKVLTNAVAYGLTNALYQGYSIDACEAYGYGILPNANLNGPGTNYIFWDPQDPTAKLHEIMADIAQQIVSPVQISQLVALNGSNRLDILNYPAGLNGFVDGSTNLVQANWTSVTNIASTNTTQSLFVIAPPLPADFGAGGGGSGGGGGGGGPPPPGSGGGSSTNSVPADNVFAQFYRLHFPYAWTWP